MPRKPPPVVGELLREWRDAVDLRLDDASVHASAQLPQRVSRETIRRYEDGSIPAAGMNPLVLLALLRLYKRRISDLPAEAQEVVKKASDLVSSAKPCTTAQELVSPHAA